MLQQLAILKGFDLDGLDPAGPDFIHFQVEAAKLAFADRDTFYGDPLHVAVPTETLLSDAYNASAGRSSASAPPSISGPARSRGTANRSRSAFPRTAAEARAPASRPRAAWPPRPRPRPPRRAGRSSAWAASPATPATWT
jgi:hypothetical protein